MYLMVEIKLKTILDDKLAQTRKTSFCCKTLVETDIKPSSSKILPSPNASMYYTSIIIIVASITKER